MNAKICTFPAAFAGFIALVSCPDAHANLVAEPTEIIYRQASGQELSAFVFEPESRPETGGAPVVLLFHGGGWSVGTPAWTFGLANALAERGALAISVEYRLSGDEITPVDAFEDVCAALGWVRDQSDVLGVDPERIALHGVSAGGHLSAMTGTKGCANGEAAPDYLLLHSPALNMAIDGWFIRLLQGQAEPIDMSPLDQISANTPATYIVSGEEDTLTPHRFAVEFCDRLAGYGQTCEVRSFPGLGHILTRNLENQESDFDIHAEDVLAARRDLIAFLERQSFLTETGGAAR